MGTNYYRLKDPWTSLRLEMGPAHDRITLWETGANAGTLTVSKGLGKAVALQFTTEEEDGSAALHTHWGGTERGSVVTENRDLLSGATVISEDGEVMKVEDVRRRDRARRSDGTPINRHPGSPWNHQFCDACYKIFESGREPRRVLTAERKRCCNCGEENTSGIYYRAHPKMFRGCQEGA